MNSADFAIDVRGVTKKFGASTFGFWWNRLPAFSVQQLAGQAGWQVANRNGQVARSTQSIKMKEEFAIDVRGVTKKFGDRTFGFWWNRLPACSVRQLAGQAGWQVANRNGQVARSTQSI
jgi:hypothetical protein